MTLKIAIATCAKLPHPADDDELLANYLRQAGFEVSYLVWNNDKIDWANYAIVLIRSTWDYHQHIEVWERWLQMLKDKQVKVLNPVETIRWNMHKSYLKELKQKGVRIVPTVFVEKGSITNLKAILEVQGWKKGVVKPAISLDAFHTWKTDLQCAESQQTTFEALITERDMMVQPFMPEIGTKGEYSFMFFGGVFSHVVLKANPTGDFRIQENYGGVNQLQEVDASLIVQAHSILQAANMPYTYARVDVIERENKLFLMELELIEPSLFLDLKEGAAKLLGDAMIQELQ